MVGDLVELGAEDTVQYDLSEDNSQKGKTFPMLDEEPEVSPEWGDQYVNALILLLRGTKLLEAKRYVGRKMPTVIQAVDPIRTSFWIHTFMRWNFLGEKLENWQQT